MKQYIYIILIMCMAAIAPVAQAQGNKAGLNKEQAEMLFNAKMKMLQEKLDLTDKQTEQLIPVYHKYSNELESIFRSRKFNRRYKPSTSQEASKVMIEHLDNDAKVIELQKKYIVEFAKILSPDQVMKIFRVEGEIQREIWKEKRRRAGKGNQSWCPRPQGEPLAMCYPRF